MIRSCASVVVLALLAFGCGLVAEEKSSPSPAPSPSGETETKPTPGPSPTPKPVSDATSTGVLWVHAEASGFDPRACDSKTPSSDFIELGSSIAGPASAAGLKMAQMNGGGGTCSFGVSPTTLSETYIFTGAALPTFGDFVGTYVTIPIVAKAVAKVKFEFFVGVDSNHRFDDVWIHEGLAIAGEWAFMNEICNTKTSFDAAMAASPIGNDVRTWLADPATAGVYDLGYDATLTFTDGTTLAIPDAGLAVGGPYRQPCPNLAR